MSAYRACAIKVTVHAAFADLDPRKVQRVTEFAISEHLVRHVIEETGASPLVERYHLRRNLERAIADEIVRHARSIAANVAADFVREPI